MIRSAMRRALSLLLSVLVVMAGCMPSVAAALPVDVTIENHVHSGEHATARDVRIDGVKAPTAGDPLDDTATVTVGEGATWDIPVLWVSSDLRIATTAEEGVSYLPVLVFYVPEDYALSGDTCTVVLSESLVELFGGNEIVSVYNQATGITYILPASVRGLFASYGNGADVMRGETPEQPDATGANEVATGEFANDGNASLVELYCAKTARDALTDEDLEWLIDLIINKLEPQAVELLLNSFPAFRVAAQNGEIGREIGMYIYYDEGDKDGLWEHEPPDGALGYVSALPRTYDSDIRICYMLGINTDDMVAKDDDDNPVRDAATGKFKLVRDGMGMRNLENTIVHELFHALMDDYNRTGMLGITEANDYRLNADLDFETEELRQRYHKVLYPNWFIEGSASTVDNIFMCRRDVFDRLRWDERKQVTDSFSATGVVNNYRNLRIDNMPAYFDLSGSWSTVEDNGYGNVASAYICGYLATLYLSELAAVKDTGSTAFVLDGDTVEDVSTETFRIGLNSILERLHKGETLDQVIADISPIDDEGAKLYKDADDFEAKFIKGTPTTLPSGEVVWEEKGDASSSTFVADYLNFLNNTSGLPGRTNAANGSILLPVDTDLASPLDSTKVASSDTLKIAESNQIVPSTVSDAVAFSSGGKSDPDATEADTAKNTTTALDSAAALASKAAAESTTTAAASDAAGKVADKSAELGDGAATATLARVAEGADCAKDAAAKDAEVFEAPGERRTAEEATALQEEVTGLG